MDLTAFRVRFAEFKTTPSAFVQACLDAAALELDATELDTRYTEAHGMLAAHKICVSPYGTNARLEKEPGHTVYSKELEAIFQRTVVPLLVT